jgi:hypothetical protein
MKTPILLSVFLVSFQLYAQCTDDECGPHPGMPNYLCADGGTMAGPGDCIQNASGQCYWEIITCPSISGYLRTIEASFCMDECSQYSIETEIDPGFGSINVIPGGFILDDIDSYIDRFVDVNLGHEVSCVECSAYEIEQINISDNCQYPVDCFQDPCIEASCPAYPNAECVATFCGGCYADFYQNGEIVTDCYSSADCYNINDCSSCTDAGCFWQPTEEGICADECMVADLDCYGSSSYWVAECPEGDSCTDLSGLFFGECDMYLGVGYADGSCQYVSGCGWDVDGVDYSTAFFEYIGTCEEACAGDNMTCDEIADTYESLHVDQYATCEFDNDCMAVWGDCSVGLGGCHYSVSVDNYPGEEIDTLVDLWLEGDCMSWVCDCSAEPYAQCIDGSCTSAYCMSENPAGCFQTGCDEGYECIIDESECMPSWCGCDGFYGEWFCTEDCGGGSCVSAGLLGDLNGDGVINVMDIVLAVDAILHAEYDPMGDINGDGQLNVVDIVQLVNLILG